MKRLIALGTLLASCSSAPLPSLAETEIKLTQPVVVDLLPGGKPVVMVRFPGLPEGDKGGVPMLLDTGADLTTLGRAYAENLGLQVAHFDGETFMTGSTGNSVPMTHYAAIDALQLGGIEAKSFHVPVITSEAYEGPLYFGILGQDLFGRFVTIIDTQAGKIHFLPPSPDEQQISKYLGQTEVGVGTWKIEPIKFKPTPHMEAQFESNGETESFSILIDTGSDASFMPKAHCEILELEPIDLVTFSGVGGTLEGTRYRLQNLDLLGFTINGTIIGGPLKYGILGMDVLRNFIVILDGPGKQLWIHNPTVEPRGD